MINEIDTLRKLRETLPRFRMKWSRSTLLLNLTIPRNERTHSIITSVSIEVLNISLYYLHQWDRFA